MTLFNYFHKKFFLILILGFGLMINLQSCGIYKPVDARKVSPNVDERVKKNLMVRAKERTQRLEKLKGDDVLEELSTLFTKGIKFVEPSDLSGSLKGRQNLYNYLDMMVRDAEKTITIVTTAEGLNRKLEALMPSLEKCKKRGVKIREPCCWG